jgi:hypothetical protein
MTEIFIRELARKQLEYANLDIMQKRKENWLKLNTGISTQPLIVIDNTAFPDIFVPDSLLRCSTESARRIERELLTCIRNHEVIYDDKVIPGTYDIRKDIRIDFFGIEIKRRSSTDDFGVDLGYRIEYPIKDITSGLNNLKPASCVFLKEMTDDRIKIAQDMIGDILPVRLTCSPGGYLCALTQKALQLLGMEYFLLCLYDHPEHVHKLMDFLTLNVK